MNECSRCGKNRVGLLHRLEISTGVINSDFRKDLCCKCITFFYRWYKNKGGHYTEKRK